MARFDQEERASFMHWKRYAIKYEGSGYPPKQILRLVLGDFPKLYGGGEPTNRVFRELGFTVGEVEDDTGSDDDAAIEDALETTLHLESDLEGFLVNHLDGLEAGLRLYGVDGISGRQFDAGPAGRIDILATDAQGDFVVIELKAGEADRQVCGQIQAYMGWATGALSSGRPVRGILVAGDFTERAKLAARVVPGLSLRAYSVTFKFLEP
jgi:RecB family endonuclease NucS